MFKSVLQKFTALGLCFSALVILAVGCSQAPEDTVVEAPSYFGSGAQEASFSFDTRIVMAKSLGKPNEASIRNSVKSVMRFMLGSIHDYGSVYAGFETKINSVKTLENGDYNVLYRLSGKGVFKKGIAAMPMNVPIKPEKLWKLARQKCQPVGEDIDEGSFWYSWQPEKNQCPLVKNQDWMQVQVRLTVLPVTTDTYPEYERLVVDQELKGTVFFGAASHSNKNWNPLDPELKDEGAKSYLQAREFMVGKLGYTASTLSVEEVRSLFKLNDKFLVPFAEEMTKVTAKGTIRIRFLFLETGFYKEGNEAFHFILRDAVKNESVIFYDGHSGIGRNLNLDSIEADHNFKINFNPNYQLIYFGSCLPYAYYTDLFFKRKITEEDPNGTKNLDILAYAKESHFGNIENLRLFLALDNYMSAGVKTSYQKIITETPKDFFGVIGDEDNNSPVLSKSAQVTKVNKSKNK